MMRVPSDLVGKFNARFIRKALKTDRPAEAKLLAESLSSKAKSTFTLLRAEVLSPEQEKLVISSYTSTREKPSKRKSLRLSELYDLYYDEKSPA